MELYGMHSFVSDLFCSIDCFGIHPYCCTYEWFAPFNCWVEFHCKNVPYQIKPVGPKGKRKWKSLSHGRLFATPWTTQSKEFSIPEHWSGKPFPSPGDPSSPGIKPRSPTLQVNSLPAEPPGKPKNTGVRSLSLLQQIFPTQESNQGLLQGRQILYQLS